LVLDYLCEHSSGSSSTKSNRLDTARKQDVSILQSLNARLSVRAMSVYHLVAGTVSSCVLSILQTRRPLPDMLFQAVNTLMSSARYAPPAMRPSESSFTGYLVAEKGAEDIPTTSHETDVQLVIAASLDDLCLAGRGAGKSEARELSRFFSRTTFLFWGRDSLRFLVACRTKGRGHCPRCERYLSRLPSHTRDDGLGAFRLVPALSGR
jgi:hypothetical protein